MLRRNNGVHEVRHDPRTQAAIEAGHPEWAELPTLSNRGQQRYFTGQPCKYGHVFPRQRQGICEECNRIKSRETQAKLRRDDPERVKAYGRAYAENHDLNAKAREYYRRTRDARMEWEKKWRAENADKVKAYDRKSRRKNAPQKLEYDRKWRDENRGRYRAYQRHRQALKAQATPPWMTEQQIEDVRVIYEEAARLEKVTGLLHEVDHIIPLNHPDVCGLHVAWNLQILNREDNRAKSNLFDGTMENEGWRSAVGV